MADEVQLQPVGIPSSPRTNRMGLGLSASQDSPRPPPTLALCFKWLEHLHLKGLSQAYIALRHHFS